MRRWAYRHASVVRLHEGVDPGAPGAAITVSLCGHWEHEGPCPIAEHHTGAQPDGDELRLLTEFDVAPDREAEVRELIRAGLAAGPWDLVRSD